MLSSLPKPIIFAHRGASIAAPENTLAAFNTAVQLGAQAIELDVQLSSDGHVVVIHDHTVDRTTNGSGTVRHMTLAALKELDAGSFHDPSFLNERIPTLDQVFQEVGQKVFINIELKNDDALFDNLPEAVARIVQSHQMHSKILFSSFNPIALYKIKRILPEVPCGLLVFPGLLGSLTILLGRLFIRYEALHPNAKSVTPSLVEKVHLAGQKVFAYTVNHPIEMQKLFAMGVDGIFTDNPELGIKLLDAKLTILSDN